jgi:hypothetical protein
MKAAQITFYSLVSLGFLGGIANAWKSAGVYKYSGGSQIRATLSQLFSIVGFIDYFLVPTLFALYVSIFVAVYQITIKPRVSGKLKPVAIILTFLAGLVGQIALIFLFGFLVNSN